MQILSYGLVCSFNKNVRYISKNKTLFFPNRNINSKTCVNCVDTKQQVVIRIPTYDTKVIVWYVISNLFAHGPQFLEDATINGVSKIRSLQRYAAK